MKTYAPLVRDQQRRPAAEPEDVASRGRSGAPSTLSALRRSVQPRFAAVGAAQDRRQVVQRAMGMELEMRRTIVDPAGRFIEKGDSVVIDHPDFKLVTDKFQGTSNLEFVMKHFDQLNIGEAEALEELNRRVSEMRKFALALYAAERRVGDIPGVGTERDNPYKPAVLGKGGAAFSASDATIRAAEEDDGNLYVHYTVGFQPKHWGHALRSAAAASRGPSGEQRAQTHAADGLEAATAAMAGLPTRRLDADEKRELAGHLALMYMQMMVFVDRTLDKQQELLVGQKGALDTRVSTLKAQVLRLQTKKDTTGLTMNERNRLRTRRNQLSTARDKLAAVRRKIAQVREQLPFGGGQPKNKIVALPRAPLADAFATLSPHVQAVLTGRNDAVLNSFAKTIETKHGLDLPENFSLHSDAGEAELGQYLGAGLGSGERISQQVVFGGLNEVGIDEASAPGKKLLPMEFRSLFKHRSSWDEVEADARRVLLWSRDPERRTLV
jgi:hypothetical protein